MPVIRFGPGGGVRKLFATTDRSVFGAIPRRASRVEVVECGPHQGNFHIELSPLGSQYQFCLVQTFADYAEAVQAEQDWLERNWING